MVLKAAVPIGTGQKWQGHGANQRSWEIKGPSGTLDFQHPYFWVFFHVYRIISGKLKVLFIFQLFPNGLKFWLNQPS